MILKKHNVERCTTEQSSIERLKKDGYKEVTNETRELNLEKMKLSDLRALAADKGIDGYEDMKKEVLVEILKDVM